MDDARRAALARGAVEHAGGFSWDATVDGLQQAYGAATASFARSLAGAAL